jgi:hypothetical protein
MHEMGFSRSSMVLPGVQEGIALPLFGVHVGLEIGQILIVMAVLMPWALEAASTRGFSPEDGDSSEG